MNLNKNIIGLTGKYCSGKSSVEKLLINKFGFFSIDVDLIGHKVLEEKKEKLINAFGENIITNNKIDRKKLGTIVFKNKKKLLKLNSIVHPAMVKIVTEQIKNSKADNICINAALLFEMGLYKLCSKIVIVRSSLYNIITRAKKRDDRSIFQTLRIILKQNGIITLKKLVLNADIFYIENNKNLQYLEIQLNNIIK